jgi:hypothetical protein
MSQTAERRRTLNIAEAVRREIKRGRLSFRREGMRRYVFDVDFIEQYRQRNTTKVEG